MNKYLLLLFFSFFSVTVLAQKSVEQEYVGTLQLENKDILTVKLNFSQLPNGKIEGSSITDIYGTDRTKTKIVGNIIAKKNVISFKEITNISTKSNANLSEFCFIEVNNATIKKIKGKSMISGKFIGKFSNGEICASGLIYLINTSFLEKFEKEIINTNRIKNTDTLKSVQQKINNIKEKSEKNILQSQEVLNVNWNSNEIILDVWDGDQVDQDEVELFLNGQKIIDRFILKQQRKTIVVPFASETCELKIVGIDEGTSYPCTANVLLRDGGNNTSIVAILKQGESTTVRLTKTK